MILHLFIFTDVANMIFENETFMLIGWHNPSRINFLKRSILIFVNFSIFLYQNMSIGDIDITKWTNHVTKYLWSTDGKYECWKPDSNHF